MSIHLTIRRWTEYEFLNSKEEWQELLENNSSDKLFLSWYWMYYWWEIWGKNSSSNNIYVLAAYDGNILVGIAPLYLSRVRMFKGLHSISRLQFLGTNFRVGGDIRAEYLEFIAMDEIKPDVNKALFDYIYKDNSWDELILSDLIVDSETYKENTRCINSYNCYRRKLQTECTYVVDCSIPFEEYLAGLGKNTRLKLYNRRKQLEKHGIITIGRIKMEDIEKFIETLNNLHEKRWSKLCFNSEQASFFSKMLVSFNTDKTTYCSELKVNNSILATMANLKVEDKIYNIQVGFIEDFDKKISLGTLHLGYVLENVFKEKSLDTFDLLAGSGKKSNFKQRLSKSHTVLETSQNIKNSILKLLYSIYDRVKYNSSP